VKTRATSQLAQTNKASELMTACYTKLKYLFHIMELMFHLQ
jgi:hypothetical protein